MSGSDEQPKETAVPRGESAPAPHAAPAAGPTQHSIDHHDEHTPPNTWRRMWRIGRVGLVGSAIVVVSANLIRCLAVAPATAHVTPDSVGTQPPPPDAGAQSPKTLSAQQAAAEEVGGSSTFRSPTGRVGPQR